MKRPSELTREQLEEIIGRIRDILWRQCRLPDYAACGSQNDATSGESSSEGLHVPGIRCHSRDWE